MYTLVVFHKIRKFVVVTRDSKKEKTYKSGQKLLNTTINCKGNCDIR